MRKLLLLGALAFFAFTASAQSDAPACTEKAKQKKFVRRLGECSETCANKKTGTCCEGKKDGDKKGCSKEGDKKACCSKDADKKVVQDETRNLAQRLVLSGKKTANNEKQKVLREQQQAVGMSKYPWDFK